MQKTITISRSLAPRLQEMKASALKVYVSLLLASNGKPVRASTKELARLCNLSRTTTLTGLRVLAESLPRTRFRYRRAAHPYDKSEFFVR